MNLEKKGILVVVSGFSGSGKGTIMKELLKKYPEQYALSISATTRQPREGETDGVEYFFKETKEFEQMIAEDAFIEYAQYVGNYYGTSLKVIEEKLAAGIDVLLDIEVQGAAKVRAKCPEAVLIFIIPPSFEELSRRLHGRHTDGEDVIAGRLQKAREEYKEIPHYDYLVVNDKVSEAAAEIISILVAEGCRTRNRIHLVEGV